MRVTVLHNPRAGDGLLTRSRLMGLLEDQGHVASYLSTKKSGWKRALTETDADIVLTVGGDGTIAKAARRLAGTEVPIAVVPAGTANNIARGFGLEMNESQLEAAERTVAALSHARAVRTDLGVLASGRRKPRHFIEGFGLGLIPSLLHSAPTHIDKRDLAAGEELTRATELTMAILAGLPELELTVHADGADLSGGYLLAEVMNVRSAGPRVVFAPDADPGDGRLDLLLLQASSRAAAVEALRSGAPWDAEHVPAVRAQAARVELGWRDALAHVDDDIWPGGRDTGTGARAVTLTVDRGCIQVVRP